MAASGARVESIDAIRAFKVALIKFAETSNIALGGAESDLHRTLSWLQNQQASHWSMQHRKRTELVNRCKEAVREKQLYKDATKSRQSAIEEEKALRAAVRSLEEAEQKLANIKKHALRLEKEIMLYKGQVQRFITSVTVDVPRAVARLENLLRTLDAYVDLGAVDASARGSEALAEIVRGSAGAPPEDIATPLRRLTPGARVRGIAPPAGNIPTTWAVKSLEAWEREIISRLAGQRNSAVPASTICVAAGMEQCPKICLERVSPAAAGDSGWYIGPAEGSPAGECQTVAVAKLLEIRPDLRELLDMPEGTLAVLDAAGVVHVFDMENVDLWVAPKQDEE